MEDAHTPWFSAARDGNSSWQQWETSLQLLRLVQSDYRRAREHLEDLCTAFGEREHVTGEYLRTALEVAAPPRPPSLGPTTRLPFLLGVVSTPVMDAPWQRIQATATRAPLQVRCLGPLEVRLGWAKVDSWHSKKARALLKYLIAERGRSVPKDVLMETLWPDADPQAANNNLKAAVHALRQTLDTTGQRGDAKDSVSYVLFTDGSYMLNSEVEIWVDVDEFEHQWAIGRRLDREGETSEAMTAYVAAERLYRGDFLEEDPYEDWTLLRREALKDTYLAILSRLAERSLQDDDCESCILYCQKILAKDQCREDAYRNLMRCHSRLGHRSRALNWYKVCVKTLKTELEAAPDGDTAALYERLLQGDTI